MTLLSKNVSLAEWFNQSKENGNNEVKAHESAVETKSEELLAPHATEEANPVVALTLCSGIRSPESSCEAGLRRDQAPPLRPC
jgi:hypothetical protein